MDSSISLSFEGSEGAHSLFSEAGATKGDRVRLVVEVTMQEMSEEGVSLFPEVVESVDVIAESEPAEDIEGPQNTPDTEDDAAIPGMVVLMDKKKKEEDG